MAPSSPFRMPKRAKISGRSSTITNSFVQAILPQREPSEGEVSEALQILGIDPENLCCSYCGDTATEWDHLRPLVEDKLPTGFFSEIGNLVPACGKCNQSKGNKPWRGWMKSDASLSPATRGIADLHERIERLERYEAWKPRRPLDLQEHVAEDQWQSYWTKREDALKVLRESQDLAEEIRARLLESISDLL